MVYYMWLIAALVLFVFEIIVPGFVILWFGVGALVAALLSAAGVDSPLLQIIVFAVVSLALVAASRSIFKNIFVRNSPGSDLKSNAEAIIGKKGVVSQTIDNSLSAGRVIIDSQDWAARSLNGNVIPAGENITVRKIDGIKLIVE